MKVTQEMLATQQPEVPRTVAKRFGLGDVGLVARLQGGRGAEVTLVEAADGSFYVVRSYHRPGVTREAIAWQHRLLHLMGTRVKEIVRPLIAPGGVCTVEIDKVYYSVFRYVHGEAANRDETIRAGAARLLAKFHSVSTSVRVPWPKEASDATLSTMASTFAKLPPRRVQL
jgi:Ser/Thr protein kinase RdoA (MazF antagonist)